MDDFVHFASVVFIVVVVLKVIELVDSERVADRRAGRDWLGPITRNQRRFGAYTSVVPYLIVEDDEENEDGLPCNRVGTFRNYFRLSRGQFDYVLAAISDEIRRQDTHFRRAISPEEQLLVCCLCCYSLYLRSCMYNFPVDNDVQFTAVYVHVACNVY